VTAQQASPWDVLLRAPRYCRAQPADEASTPARRQGTKLAGLLALLAESSSLPTLALAVRADLTPNQVWGLLKQPRALGQVTFEDGRWTLVRDFAGNDVVRAVQLLQDKGWRCTPPAGRTC
jgi:hypothetical protein